MVIDKTTGRGCAWGLAAKPITERLIADGIVGNENEVFSLDKGARLFPYGGKMKFNIFRIRGESCFNMNVWSKAASQFKVGMTLEECVGIFLKTELAHRSPQELSPVGRLVQYMAQPVYERVPGNNDEATFDRIGRN